MKTKTTSSLSQEQNLIQTPNLLKKPKIGKEANKRRLPLVPEPNSKKKRVKQVDQSRKKISYVGKESKGQSPISYLNPKGILHVRKESLHPNTALVLDRNEKESMLVANDSKLRNSAVGFDLNQDSTQEASLPTRTPIFDLNEISVGNSDFFEFQHFQKFSIYCCILIVFCIHVML